MSTYYYLVCEEHKAASDLIGGRSFPDRWWQTGNREMPNFLALHADCKPIVVSEHDERLEHYEMVTGDPDKGDD